MKFIFFLTLLINITFFLWEYRKGAPVSYLPQRLEYSQRDAQNIILLSNPPAIPEETINDIDVDQEQPELQSEQQLITDNQNSGVAFTGPRQLNVATQDKPATPANKVVITEFVGPVYQQPEVIHEDDFVGPKIESPKKLLEPTINKQQTVIDDALITSKNKATIAPPAVAVSKIQPLLACFQVYRDATKQDFIASNDNSPKYILTYTEQEEPFISNYLVLTLPVDTFDQAQTRKERLIEQGISDLWLFKKGVFKWRISLGLFSSSEKAVRAKEQYAMETTVSLEVVPSWQTHIVKKVSLQTKEKQIISDFAKNYSHLIAKEVDCSPVKQ